METRNLVLAIAGIVLIAACGALALGWKDVAEDAMRQTEVVKEKQRKRVADLPRIVVGFRDITFRGEPMTTLEELSNANSLDRLLERLERDRKTQCDASRICLDNIVVLENVLGPSSGVTDRVVRTAWAAGYDIVHAPPRNETW